MMPTFPLPSLKFRTAGFPQYGFKAGRSDRAFPFYAASRQTVCHCPSCSPLPSSDPRSVPGDVARWKHLRSSGRCRSTPGGLRSGPGCSVPFHPHLRQAHLDFTAQRLIRNAFTVHTAPKRPPSGSALSLSFLPNMPPSTTPGRSETGWFQSCGRMIFQAVRSGRFFALVALVGLGLLSTASGAKADCGLPYKTGAVPRIPFLSNQVDESSNHREDEASNKPASILGLWHLIYIATFASGPFPPTPFQFLESFKTWHADGTEFENAFLPPTGGNICFGVWQDLSDGRVKLHRIGLMFDSTGNVSNIFTVDEKDTIASNGKSYSGTFDFKLWPPSFNAVGIGSPLAEVTGTTAGTRITID